MPSPLAGGTSWLRSPSQQRCKSKPKEVLVTNFDKLFEDDRVRRRARSCYRTEKVFGRGEEAELSASSPVPVPGCRVEGVAPQVTSYRVVDRSGGRSLLDRISGKQKQKSVKEVAEEVRAAALQVCCDPGRPLPGLPGVVTPAQRLQCGLDCDEVLPRHLLASGRTVKNVAYLRDLGVTHILNTASRDVWLPVEKLTNLGLQIFQFHVDDIPSANISAYFQAAASFLARASSEGGLVVVNCLVGLSRSATVLTAALMINQHWSVARSLRKLRQSRPVKPNIGFMVQLLSLEQQLAKSGVHLV